MDELVRLENHAEYVHLFVDVAFWQPFVKEVCRRHHLSPHEPVRIGIPGSLPTFIVAEQWVIKFFGRLFGGEKSFAVEREASRLASLDPAIPIARVIAEGALGGSGWPWPYLIYPYIPGASLGELADQLSEEDWLRIARDLGEITRRLHNLPLENSSVFPSNLDEYTRLLEKQRATCLERHRGWGSLPARLVEQIEDYLPPLERLVDRDRAAHLIHADLTRDHLLGRLENGRWNTLALIDFGDAMTGDLLYELVALQMDIFQTNRRQLGVFLDSYGLESQARYDLAPKAFATALLHQFNIFVNLPKEALRAQTLEQLAEILWGE